MTAVIIGIVAAGLFIIKKWDIGLVLNRKMYAGILASAFLQAGILCRIMDVDALCDRLLMAVIGGSLLLASAVDIAICQVHNFIWWPALAAALILLGRSQEMTAPKEGIGTLLCFGMLQFFLFRRMYGRADCYGFCVCAVAETAQGIGLTGLLVHMLLAYALLLPVQALRKNIDRKGNLRTPVPFLPYINISFWLTILLFSSKGYFLADNSCVSIYFLV